MPLRIPTLAASLTLALVGSVALAQTAPAPTPKTAKAEPRSPDGKHYLSQPL